MLNGKWPTNKSSPEACLLERRSRHECPGPSNGTSAPIKLNACVRRLGNQRTRNTFYSLKEGGEIHETENSNCCARSAWWRRTHLDCGVCNAERDSKRERDRRSGFERGAGALGLPSGAPLLLAPWLARLVWLLRPEAAAVEGAPSLASLVRLEAPAANARGLFVSIVASGPVQAGSSSGLSPNLNPVAIRHCARHRRERIRGPSV
jgi:hypothetical protein